MGSGVQSDFGGDFSVEGEGVDKENRPALQVGTIIGQEAVAIQTWSGACSGAAGLWPASG